jgi:putative tricarboxylic transport membrane protein
MVFFETLQLGIENVFSIGPLLLIAGGVLFGIIFGAIPGLTATLAVALLLPFTYGLGPYNGLSLLLGIYVGAISGGLISATLLKIPGTPSSIVTTFDAYPMAKNGKPLEALSIGVFSSLIGGIFSTIILIIIAPQLARIALQFGPWEYFSLGIFGLSVIASLSAKNINKGLIATLIGMLIATVGMDPVTAHPRFTLGFLQMEGGFSPLATMLGFYAATQIFLDSREVNIDTTAIALEKKRNLLTMPFKLVRHQIINFLRSSVIGTFIGILPGAGGSTAGFIAYDQAKKASHQKEKFGTGHYEGIIASETSNNAVTGGALIPMMTLGIPGDVVTAILLGGLMIHGLQPGPLLFRDNADVVGTIFVALFVANVMMYIIELGLMRKLARMIQVPKHFLLPTIMMMCVIGVFSLNNRVFDMWVLLVFGVLGYIFIKNEIPPAPIVLGYILTDIIERNWRIAVMSERGDVTPFFTRPISVVLLLLALVSILYPIISERISDKRKNHAD